MQPLRIGNAQAFWGDDPNAAARLAAQAPDMDYLTLDYLAEVSMSILAKQRERDPSAGYARDFVEVIASLATTWREGRRLKVVSNAGGLNPLQCARACKEVLTKAGVRGLKIGIVSGDDVAPIMRSASTGEFGHLETGAALATVLPSLVTANAYLGAAPLVTALKSGADIVITGRVADPSLVVAPCIANFGWSADQYDRIAGATIAGHLIECGTQVSGGICTDWLAIKDHDIGFPIVEVAEDGSCVVTKPTNTGGCVNEQTVKEQLLYETGDPARYLSPDATVSFLTLNVKVLENDRVKVSGASGSAPPPSYKVSATYRTGYRASGMLTIPGPRAVEKARVCTEMILKRLTSRPKHFQAEFLGTGAVFAGTWPSVDSPELVLRISVADPKREIVERFTRELMPLITSGPQGTTGYAEGRPAVREVFGYWPTLIERSRVQPKVEFLEI